MNTFIPYPDAPKSAEALDRQRLGKQRIEVLQMLRALLGETAGWRNHPAVKMWAGHEGALVRYGYAICAEWVGRGYLDTCRAKLEELAARYGLDVQHPYPAWWGGPVHASHRARLLAKDPEHYGRYGWTETPAETVLWPEAV